MKDERSFSATEAEVLTTISAARNQILENLRDDKEYRDAFVAERIATRLPLRIRALRGELTQKQIATLSGKAQTWISKLEDPNYGKFTLATLLDIAAIYDVGLEVDFVPFSRLLDEITHVTPETFASVPSFVDEDENDVFQNNAGGLASGIDQDQKAGQPPSPGDRIRPQSAGLFSNQVEAGGAR